MDGFGLSGGKFRRRSHATTRRPDNLIPANPRLSDDLFFRYHNARHNTDKHHDPDTATPIRHTGIRFGPIRRTANPAARLYRPAQKVE